MKKRLHTRKLWLLSTFILLANAGISQLTQEWVARSNGPAGNNTDGARSLALDRDGNVYITGSGTGTGSGLDYITIKYNAAGVQQWEARYNGPGNSDDDAFSIALDLRGNVYVTGSLGKQV